MTEYQWEDAGNFGTLYEELFVPALFLPWGEKSVEAAAIKPGETVLDAACGTGVVARFAREKTSHVVGIDLSDAMLAAARELDSTVEWRQGDVTDMPFDANAFDVAICQFALMFFPDKTRALRELARVAKRLVVVVWQELDQSPGYREFVQLIRETAGSEPADVLASPFSLGDVATTRALFRDAGLSPTVATDATEARFSSIADWVTTDVRATPLTAHFDAQALEKLITAAQSTLSQYTDDSGVVRFPAPAHLFSCTTE
ncbi:MAG: methyltransferase domain-containing protein [Pseudomonadota bacterium]